MTKAQPLLTCLAVCCAAAIASAQSHTADNGRDPEPFLSAVSLIEAGNEQEAARHLDAKWVEKFSPLIEETVPGPFLPGYWGCSRAKEIRVYLFIRNWQPGNVMQLPNGDLPIKQTTCRALTGGKVRLKWPLGTEVFMDRSERDPVATVIEYQVEGNAETAVISRSAAGYYGGPRREPSARTRAQTRWHIEPKQVARLQEIGTWLQKNGESIYGTRGGPFMSDKDFASTCKGNTIYLHLLNGRKEVVLPAMQADIESVSILNGSPVKLEKKDGNLVVRVDDKLADPIDTIVAVTIHKPALSITPVNIADVEGDVPE